MAKSLISFKGRTAHLRVLNKADLVSRGLNDSVDFKRTEFWADQPVEVDSAVAEILLSDDEFSGQFGEAKTEEKPQPVSTDKPTTPDSPNKK